MFPDTECWPWLWWSWRAASSHSRHGNPPPWRRRGWPPSGWLAERSAKPIRPPRSWCPPVPRRCSAGLRDRRYGRRARGGGGRHPPRAHDAVQRGARPVSDRCPTDAAVGGQSGGRAGVPHDRGARGAENYHRRSAVTTAQTQLQTDVAKGAVDSTGAGVWQPRFAVGDAVTTGQVLDTVGGTPVTSALSGTVAQVVAPADTSVRAGAVLVLIKWTRLSRPPIA